MTTENWLFQVSPKLADGTLINLRGSDPEEFGRVVDWATENAAKFVDVVTAINAVNKVPALAGNVTSTQVQHAAPAQAVQQQAATSWSGNAAPAQSGGSTTEVDKWNNKWEYDCPDAPLTPRGPAVLKHGTSQAGKAYMKWEDPAAGPRWFAQRQPKVEPAARWQGSFVNNR